MLLGESIYGRVTSGYLLREVRGVIDETTKHLSLRQGFVGCLPVNHLTVKEVVAISVIRSPFSESSFPLPVLIPLACLI